MHIAVIADIPVERKHLERLLKRANDALSGEIGTLYVDSFGDTSALLKAPMKYDLFIMDVSANPSAESELAVRLETLGAKGAVLTCLPEESSLVKKTVASDFLTISKPISPAALHDLIRGIHDRVKSLSAVPTLEIRNKSGTVYIPASRVLYVTTRHHLVDLHLTDGSVVQMLGSLMQFMSMTEIYNFMQIKKDLVINSDLIKKRSSHNILMSDGTSFHVSRFDTLLLAVDNFIRQ